MLNKSYYFFLEVEYPALWGSLISSRVAYVQWTCYGIIQQILFPAVLNGQSFSIPFSLQVFLLQYSNFIFTGKDSRLLFCQPENGASGYSPLMSCASYQPCLCFFSPAMAQRYFCIAFFHCIIDSSKIPMSWILQKHFPC